MNETLNDEAQEDDNDRKVGEDAINKFTNSYYEGSFEDGAKQAAENYGKRALSRLSEEIWNEKKECEKLLETLEEQMEKAEDKKNKKMDALEKFIEKNKTATNPILKKQYEEEINDCLKVMLCMSWCRGCSIKSQEPKNKC